MKNKDSTPEWGFSTDEKIILKNLYEKFIAIARDKTGKLYLYSYLPKKDKIRGEWGSIYRLRVPLNGFDLFKSIKWSDSQACEFRKYI